jgi:hypothetical protein
LATFAHGGREPGAFPAFDRRRLAERAASFHTSVRLSDSAQTAGPPVTHGGWNARCARRPGNGNGQRSATGRTRANGAQCFGDQRRLGSRCAGRPLVCLLRDLITQHPGILQTCITTALYCAIGRRSFLRDIDDGACEAIGYPVAIKCKFPAPVQPTDFFVRDYAAVLREQRSRRRAFDGLGQGDQIIRVDGAHPALLRRALGGILGIDMVRRTFAAVGTT